MFGQFSLNHQYGVWFHCMACSRASPTVTQVLFFFFYDQVSKFQRKCSESPSAPIQKHLILLRALNVLFCVVG